MKIPGSQTTIIIARSGGPEVLVPWKMAVPRPGLRQVLIRVAAAGVNRHDVNQRASGIHHDGSAVPGLEVSGEIAATGAEVGDLKVGSRVMALVQGGGYAEYVVAEAVLTFAVPDALSDAEAACVPEALFTAWWNFFGLMSLKKDGFAGVHGGTSGVGHLALQVLSALGYRVISTSGTPEKVEAAKGFGAFASFNYRDPGLAEKVLEASGGEGISALLDMSAGAHIEQDLAMMAPDGVIAHLSAGGKAALPVPLRQLMAKRVRLTGSFLRPLELARKTRVADALRDEAMPLLGTKVRPLIAHRFPLHMAARAHEEMEASAHVGKIVLVANGS
jgi:NADPH:quinone reductase